ncbi:MAG: hypothetical protein BZ138_05975 [Methanosphaera sp. rholeuAM270]|nr:MAG: hypothetical protein BZ138_05975 [Methanosphaera sp. rholeuAM270]
MNDIQLKQNPDGNGYDWKFQSNNVSNVKGNKQIASACIHAIMLRQNELQQGNYEGLGTMIQPMLRQKNTPTALKLIEETMKVEAKKIQGVLDAKIKIDNTNMVTPQVHIELVTENGVVKVNAI